MDILLALTTRTLLTVAHCSILNHTLQTLNPRLFVPQVGAGCNLGRQRLRGAQNPIRGSVKEGSFSGSIAGPFHCARARPCCGCERTGTLLQGGGGRWGGGAGGVKARREHGLAVLLPHTRTGGPALFQSYPHRTLDPADGDGLHRAAHAVNLGVQCRPCTHRGPSPLHSP